MIAISSTNLVSLSGHQDTISGDYINTATVTAAVLDGNTTLFSVSLAYVSSSNGTYRGTFSATQTATLAEGGSYVVEYVASSTYGKLTDRNPEIAGYV